MRDHPAGGHAAMVWDLSTVAIVGQDAPLPVRRIATAAAAAAAAAVLAWVHPA